MHTSYCNKLSDKAKPRWADLLSLALLSGQLLSEALHLGCSLLQGPLLSPAALHLLPVQILHTGKHRA